MSQNTVVLLARHPFRITLSSDALVSKDTFILLARHPFRITFSSDALVSKDTFFGRTTCFQDLEVDITCDKNHINQHKDTVLYMDTYSNIEVKVGEISYVTSHVTSQV